MKNALTISIILLFHISAIGQNLIPNPNIEGDVFYLKKTKSKTAWNESMRTEQSLNSWLYYSRDWFYQDRGHLFPPFFDIDEFKKEHDFRFDSLLSTGDYKITEGEPISKYKIECDDTLEVFFSCSLSRKQLIDDGLNGYDATISRPVIYPHSGKRYLRYFNTHDVNFYETKLLTPLAVGKHYYLEFYYSIDAFPFNERADNYHEGITLSIDKAKRMFHEGQLGVYLSEQPINMFNYEEIKVELGKIIPQIKIVFNPESMQSWVKFSIIFTPSKENQYLYVGNFRPLYPWNRSKRIYEPYFYQINFDDFKLYQLSENHLNLDFKKGDVIQIPNILFETASARLLPISIESLNIILNYLQENPDKIIKVIGHTDNIGGKEFNTKLSIQRAESVKQYLVENGVEKSRIKTDGKGSSMPVSDNRRAEGRKNNRRVEFEIL